MKKFQHQYFSWRAESIASEAKIHYNIVYLWKTGKWFETLLCIHGNLNVLV